MGTLRAGVLATLSGTPESYRLDVRGTELTVQGGDVAGVAAGMYRLADRIRSGAEVLPAADAGRVVIPRLALRLTDAGSVGREPDPAVFAAGDDYGLNTDVVGSAVLPRAPWVDADAVARIDAQFRQFVDHSVAQGFNGIVVPGFLEYVTFAKVGDGRAVYPPGDPHVDRARAMVAAFGPVFRYAEDMGVRVFLLTDMLAVSPPLEAYLTRTVGGLDAADPRLWAVYQAGLAELFESMPFVDGLMVRVGEGGEVYAGTGWDYSSRLAVTTESSVRAMLRALLDTAGPAGKEIIFRTWTVGVGAVGDLHTNPASYARVLGGIDDPHLIVSTKYTLGDFYSHLPLNTTLLGGGHRRIVEFQARREFEGFGSLPNDLGPLHRAGAARVPRRQPERRGRLELDPGRRAAARRAHVAVPARRVLAALRPQHVRRRPAGLGPARRPGAGNGGLGVPDVLRRPGHRRRDRAGHGAVPAGGHQGPLHRSVRRPVGAGARAGTAAHDVDLRVGHPDRRLRRAGQHLRGDRRPRRRGDRGGRAGRRAGPAHARPGRRDRAGDVAGRRTARALHRRLSTTRSTCSRR